MKNEASRYLVYLSSYFTSLSFQLIYRERIFRAKLEDILKKSSGFNLNDKDSVVKKCKKSCSVTTEVIPHN